MCLRVDKQSEASRFYGSLLYILKTVLKSTSHLLLRFLFGAPSGTQNLYLRQGLFFHIIHLAQIDRILRIQAGLRYKVYNIKQKTVSFDTVFRFMVHLQGLEPGTH